MATSDPRSDRLAILSLPRDLRDCIYGYLFTESFFIQNIRSGDSASSFPLKMKRHTLPAILNVSKSTHQEAKRALYRHGTFRFDSFETGPHPLYGAITNLPDIELLQSIIWHYDTATHTSLTDDPVWGHPGYMHPVVYAVKPPVVLYHNFASPMGTATRPIDHFTTLDFSIPRTRFVAEIAAGVGSEYFLGDGRDAGVFQKRAESFDRVHESGGEARVRLNDTVGISISLGPGMDEKLAMALGHGEIDSEEGPEGGRSCLVYYPQNR